MTLRLIALMMAASVFGAAQNTITVTGPATAKPGKSIQLSVSLGGQSSFGAAGLQWTMAKPQGWTFAPSAGPLAAAASKQILCGQSGICVVYGLNQNTIQGSGVVAQYSVTVPAAASPGGVSLPLSDVLAATAGGAQVPLTLGPVYSVTVLHKADLNGDGSVNDSDVLEMAKQAVGESACSDDLSGDGKCNLIDVLLAVFYALGL